MLFLAQFYQFFIQLLQLHAFCEQFFNIYGIDMKFKQNIIRYVNINVCRKIKIFYNGKVYIFFRSESCQTISNHTIRSYRQNAIRRNIEIGRFKGVFEARHMK